MQRSLRGDPSICANASSTSLTPGSDSRLSFNSVHAIAARAVARKVKMSHFAQSKSEPLVRKVGLFCAGDLKPQIST
jgi:hypothetical protein